MPDPLLCPPACVLILPHPVHQQLWNVWCRHGHLSSNCSSCPCSPPPPLLPCRWVCALPGSGFCVGEGSRGLRPLNEAEFGPRLPAAIAGSALLTMTPGPNSEKALTEYVWFSQVDVHCSFLISMPLLPPRLVGLVVALPSPTSCIFCGAAPLGPLSVHHHRTLVWPIASPCYRFLLLIPPRKAGLSVRTLSGDLALSKHGCSGDWHLVPV